MMEYLCPALCSLQVDVPVKYLTFFLDDDAELEHIKTVSTPVILTSWRPLSGQFLSGFSLQLI